MIGVRRSPVITVAAIALVALLVPLLPLADPLRIDIAHGLAPPSLLHPLGQDEHGRDVLSRLLWSARTSLAIAVASASLACLLGTALGLFGGLIRPMRRLVAAHSMDILSRFPPLPVALLIVVLFGPGVGTLIPMLAVLYAPRFVRAAPSPIMLHSILPNLAGPVLVRFSLTMASAMMLESGLSFLGLGVMAPTPSWGQMISAASATMSQAPLLLLWPCATLSLTILAIHSLCDALGDAMGSHRRPVRVRPHAEVPLPPSGRPPAGTAVLDVRNLTVEIDTPAGTLLAVHDVSFAVHAGETLAIVGTSGAGKSLTGLAVMGLLPEGARVRQGNAWLQGHDLLRLDDDAFRRVRGGVLSMTFQDALSSLNPVHHIGAQIAETMHAHFDVADYEAKEEVAALLGRVGMPDPKRCMRAYPHELSGDALQRVMLAMAIANDPRLLIVDEPTAGLDAATQARMLDLLADLRRELGMGLVYFSRSLAVAAKIADRVLVMSAGEIIEQGTVHEVLAAHSPGCPRTSAQHAG